MKRLITADFDLDLMKTMVSDHEKIAKLLQDESAKGIDADVKA